MERVTHIVSMIFLRINECVVWPFKTLLIGKRDYYRALYARGFSKHTIVVCYPEKPKTYHVLYKILHYQGYSITNTLDSRAKCVIRFEDATFGKQLPALDSFATTKPIVNMSCTDISKRHVEEVFHEVFGYGMKSNPRTHTGVCVQKSDTNAVHDGSVVACPTEPKEGYVYQLLINNEIPGEQVEDLRVVVCGTSLPFVIRRFRALHDRFDTTTDAVLVETTQALSPEEIQLVLTFCTNMGLDYGELDILRNKDDGKIYIVDVNNTPSGPIGPFYGQKAVLDDWFARMAQAFDAAFINK